MILGMYGGGVTPLAEARAGETHAETRPNPTPAQVHRRFVTDREPALTCGYGLWRTVLNGGGGTCKALYAGSIPAATSTPHSCTSES